MKLYDLIEQVATANAPTLERYNIDLHKQRLKVKQLETLENHPSGRNTMVILYANTNEVVGSQSYFYNRTTIDNKIWPEDHLPRVKRSDVNEKGLLQAILDIEDPKVDEDFVMELLNNDETNLTLHYSLTNPVDQDAYVSINCIGYYGIANLVVEIDSTEPIRLDDVLLGGILDGFYQTP